MKTGKRNSTGANGGNGEENLCSLRFLLFKSGSGGVVELDFDKSISDGVNIYAKRDGDADFVFLAGCSRLSTYRLSTINHSETARIQSRLCPKRRRDWLVQR